ncbi:MAG: GDSL-type esterase/lipase family protein [Sciscionella sp.]
MRIRRGHWIAFAAVVLAVVMVGTVLSTQLFDNSRQAIPQRPVHPGPRTVVSMGDSTISGEGAGSYSPDTDGRRVDWCHRSSKAEINELRLPETQRVVNLACSGANAEQVALGEAKQYTEPSQAGQLAALAMRNNITTIVVGVGANDDPQFGHTISACFQQWLSRGKGCTVGFDAPWRERVRKMVPKVVGTLRDIRTVMRKAHYSDGDYQLVLQSYAAPVGPGIPENLRGLAGCPFLERDLRWFVDTGVEALADGVRDAARQVGARYLDLSRAGRGHEACTGGNDKAKEWFTRLSVRWDDLGDSQRAEHALQESFHPNAAGYAQFAGCLREFLARDDRAAACLAGADGALHPAATSYG